MEGIFADVVLFHLATRMRSYINDCESYGNAKLRLVKSAQATIERDDVWTSGVDANEADYPGYAEIGLTDDAFSTPADDTIGYWIGAAEQTFTYDSGEGAGTNTIRHIVLTGNGDGGGEKILWAWTLDADKTMGADGDVIKFTPKMRVQNPPWPV